ncbi:MAG: hypothetical protein QF689_08395 [Candidatus Latescibacteria bacterium]|nr:hypothetical protein [Gemmatimonadaceae bacterium]MDP6018058.1 hypothetical protein [Candidatus Latescibacterota bacterium]MDP7448589.1 hypothetical protein [Candidatus Latescibacterota bacterium]HJP32826.1 hypothetical protein [Candidatus Latescibacterota bacterium]
MLLLFIGLLLVFVCFGVILSDMDRRRRQLADMLDRVEPLVDRSRRLHVRNMRGFNQSLFYTGNVLDQLDHEVTAREREKGCAPPPDKARFSLRPGRRFRDLDQRISALEAVLHAAAAPPDTGSDSPDVAPPADA